MSAGYAPAQHRVEPPAVVDRVDEAHLRRLGAGGLALAADVRRVDHDAELQPVALGTHRLHREAVGEQLVMGDGDGRASGR